MNAFLHQAKWDFRRIGGLWILWLVLIAAASAGSVWATMNEGPHSPVLSLFATIKNVAIYLGGALLTVRLLFTTPFTGTRAFWKTRPLPRPALFWTKSLLIVFLVWAPVVAVQFMEWKAFNLPAPFLLWATIRFASLTLALLALAAVWASLCHRSASSALGVAGTAGVLALSALLWTQISENTALLPLTIGPQSPSSTMAPSTTLVAILLGLLTAVAAWIFAARLVHRRAALLILTLGVIVIGGGGRLWRINLLSFLERDALPVVDLTADVLSRDEEVDRDQQLLWSQIAVSLPEGQIAHPDYWSCRFEQSPGHSKHVSRSAAWQRWNAIHGQRLTSLYPPGSILLTPRLDYQSCIEGPFQNDTPATLSGQASLTIYEWRKVASLPLSANTPVELRGGGLLGIHSIRQNELKIDHLKTPEPFDPVPATDAHGGIHYRDDNFYVLSHPVSGTALLAEHHGYSMRGAGSFSPQRQSISVEFSDSTWRRLTGIESLAHHRDELRLDVFRPIPVARGTLTWDEKDWLPHFGQPRPRIELPDDRPEAIARLTLPDDPTPAQVDAYLDSILFSIPESTNPDQRKRILNDLAALGPEHVERLLSRLPVGDYAEYYVYRTLPSLLTEDHREAVLEALVQDPELSSVVKKLGWQDAAAPIAAQILASHRPIDYPASTATIELAARDADPESFDDLRWHFINSRFGLREMARTLAGVPDFPFWEVLAELWKEARYEPGPRPSQLAPFAARLGDKEALRLAFVSYLDQENEQALDLLAQAVAHPGGDLLPGWLHDNFEALVFNEETRKFELP